MSTHGSLILLGALGASLAGAAATVAAAPAVDTSQWLCKSCPAEEPGISGTLDAGAGVQSRDAGKFGDYTGLDRKGGHLVLGGSLRWRGANGYWGGLEAADLGLDSRSLAGAVGQEGLYAVHFGYAEIPHFGSDSGYSPFLGVGSSVLTLPAGYPAASTAAMPLATTLKPVELGVTRKRLDLGARLNAGSDWTLRMELRHDVRDGTQRTAGSFFANAAQLVAPVDQVTDQVEVSASWSRRGLQATLAWQASTFRNGPESLTWTNPFAGGPTQGQLALAPDNQFNQLLASFGWEISPVVRASGEFAWGRATQDAPYLAATLNPALTVAALPAVTLDGKATNFNANLRLTAAPTDSLRVVASYTRDERDADSPVATYPSVSTDLFVGLPRANVNHDYTRQRLKLGADHRGGPWGLKLAGGIEHETIDRGQQEVDTTREDTVWVRAAAQPLDKVSGSLKLLHAERLRSGYNAVASIVPAENPLLRKFNMADRRRDQVGLRADVGLAEGVNVGLSTDWSMDEYERSAVGLRDGRSVQAAVDLSWAISDETQLTAWVQEEQIRSNQAGSQLAGAVDWTGRTKDVSDLLGIGVRHLAMKGKLELGADLSMSRTRSDVIVATGGAGSVFPRPTTTLDSLKLRAVYQLDAKLSLYGSWWYERYGAVDWRLDGVTPSTVPNVLLLGEQTPSYHVNVVRVGLRYKF